MILLVYSNPDRPFNVPQGRKPTLPSDLEQSLRSFCEHAWAMGMPRTQVMLSEDIRDFVCRKNVPCPYHQKGPGN